MASNQLPTIGENTTMSRAHNFCAGPCALPESVLSELGGEMLEYGNTGVSVIEMSHRSKEYEAIHFEALRLLQSLYQVPADFDALLIQGGATLQFAMIPMNLLAGPGAKAGYIESGSWGRKALADAAKVSASYSAWSGAECGYSRMPAASELTVEADTDFIHLTSNETIEGVRRTAFDGFDARLIGDMSSDFLSRPIDWSPFDLVYGGVQKNLGPAGMAVVFVRKSLLERIPDSLPTYLRFDTHAKADSLANTPAMFPIYVMGKVLRWMEDNGGVAGMEKRSIERSSLVYDVIDSSDGFFTNPVEPAHRSRMNIVFRLGSEALEADFLAEAEKASMLNLAGHRSVGGIRASVYNGLPTASVFALTSFMTDFADRRG